jgi:hypothetical protein
MECEFVGAAPSRWSAHASLRPEDAVKPLCVSALGELSLSRSPQRARAVLYIRLFARTVLGCLLHLLTAEVGPKRRSRNVCSHAAVGG